MTIAGLIWIAIIIVVILKNDIKDMLLLLLVCMTLQACNVIIINGQGIGPGVLTALIFVIYALFHAHFRICLEKRKWPIFVSLFLVMIIPFITSMLNEKLFSTWLVILQLWVYGSCFLVIQCGVAKISRIDLYNIVRKLIVFHCWMAVLQVLTTMEILPLRPIFNILIFNDKGQNVVFHWNSYNRMLSTFMEPSYYAVFLVAAFFFLLCLKEKWKDNYFLLSVVFIEILLTRSSTAYGAFLITAIIFVCFSKNLSLKQKIVFIGIGLVGLCVVYVGFYSLIDAVIFSKRDTASYRQRVRFNSSALNGLKASPIYGIGYKQCRGSSIIPSLLGQTGIMGLFSYVAFNVSIMKTRVYKETSNAILLLATKFAVLGAIVAQIIACPDLDLCSYWCWLLILSAVI